MGDHGKPNSSKLTTNSYQAGRGTQLSLPIHIPDVKGMYTACTQYK